ncbi:MAG: glutamyl-tRNA reductase [Chitinivibrionales bacterium]|nr:glutamyl-tRNA reductase [Chitinivibrionales bacterium]
MATELQTSIRHVAVVGINHTTSDARLRDRLLFADGSIEAALQRMQTTPQLDECLILSTCNRVEVYIVLQNPDNAVQLISDFLAGFHSVSSAEFGNRLYFYRCEEAVDHLFNVAAGLDSLVIGEYQILGQVKGAHQRACASGSTSAMLNKLFQFAVEAAKRVRNESDIGAGLLSVASVAVDLARKVVGTLDHRTALIIGAGKMSEITAQHLVCNNIGHLICANRTRHKAEQTARQFCGMPIGLDELDDHLHRADIVVTATGASGYVLKKDSVRKAMNRRKNDPTFFIDIAAPRDIDPEVANVYNAFLYSIDDLSAIVNKTVNRRSSEIAKARALLQEEKQKYFEWYRAQRVVPAMVDLRSEFEHLCEVELARYASSIEQLPEDARQTIRQFASSLTKSFLRTPTKVLKAKSADADAAEFVRVVQQLFSLTKV